MDKITLEKLNDIIRQGNFEFLKDQLENEFLECKREPYQIDKDSIKRELAKDVSSFANSDGGYILIGIETKKSELHSVDIISRINYLEKSIIDHKQYYNIIKEWVYPEIMGLKLFWIKSDQAVNKGIFVIFIPKQNSTSKPFLITKAVDERKKSEILFGYAERKFDSSEPKDIHVIHGLIRDGSNYTQNIESRFNKIDALLESSKKKEEIERLEDLEQNIVRRIFETLKVNDMSKGRATILVAYPKTSNLLNTVFERKEGSILRKLEHPGELRYAGWDLETLDSAKIFEGQYIQVCNGDRKTICLYKDGALFFSANAGFWGWPDESGKKVNCLAIVESTYNFVSFYKSIINDFVYPESLIYFKFGVFNFHKDGVKSYLCPGSLRSPSFSFADNPKHAPRNEYISQPCLFDFAKINEAVIAYEIIKEIYLWFGIPLGDGAIPYLKNENGINMVDIDKIKNAK